MTRGKPWEKHGKNLGKSGWNGFWAEHFDSLLVEMKNTVMMKGVSMDLADVFAKFQKISMETLIKPSPLSLFSSMQCLVIAYSHTNTLIAMKIRDSNGSTLY